MARDMSAFEKALVAALNANTDALKALGALVQAPAPAQARAKAKVAQPKAEVKQSGLVTCGREIPCDRVFLAGGAGVDNHICRGFTGTSNKRRLS